MCDFKHWHNGSYNDDPVNIFRGKWEIVDLHIYTREEGWTVLEQYSPQSLVWEFEAERRLPFESGETAFEGMLKEHSYMRLKEITEYAYYPSGHELYIDRSDYDAPGMCVNDRYRVEYIGEGEYWLFDLGDAGKEPKDYRFKIKIRQLSMN